MVNRFEKFSFMITEIYRYLRKIESDEMEKFGLKGSCAIYLLILYKYKEGIPSAKISELCGKNKADVSRAITDMLKKGLVCREEGSATKLYRAPIRLTELGRSAAEALAELAVIAVSEVSRDIPPDMIVLFYDAIDTICQNLKIMSERGIQKDLSEE